MREVVPWEMCEDHSCKGREHKAIQVPIMQHEAGQALGCEMAINEGNMSQSECMFMDDKMHFKIVTSLTGFHFHDSVYV